MKIYHVRQSQNHMATTFHLVVSESARITAAEAVLSEAHVGISQLENELSEFREWSPVYRLNHAAPGQPVVFPRATWFCFQRALYWEEQTQGAFSAAAKSVISEDGESLCPFGWDETSFTVWRRHPGAHLGFGAIGKGFALDEVRSLIEQAGFFDFFLSAGGSSLLLSGYAERNEPWRWAWSWQKTEAGEPLGLPLLHANGQPIGIVVSGMQEQGAHLLDPKTQGPSQPNLSALAATSSAADADALSTALFVSGWDNARARFSDQALNHSLAFVSEDQCPRWNGLFAKLWGHPVTTAAVAFTFLFSSVVALAEEAVDLKDFGVDDFTPYLFERNTWWIALPIAALVLVFIHLENNNPKRTAGPHSSEKTP